MIFLFKKRKLASLIAALFSSESNYDVYNNDVVFSLEGTKNNSTSELAIIDSSQFNNTAITFGKVTQAYSTIGNYITSTGSLYFSKTGGGVAFDTPNLRIGSNLFTLEFFINPDVVGSTYNIFNQSISTSSYAADGLVVKMVTTGRIYIGAKFGAQTTAMTTSVSVPVNRWSHVAIVRKSATEMAVYINGKTAASTSSLLPGFFINNSINTTILGMLSAADAAKFNGYISNLRLNIGSAVYTADFQPPTSVLEADNTTALLLKFDNGFIVDNTGNTAIENFGVTSQSNVTIINPTTLNFNGGDYLTIPPNSKLDFGTSDFTIELWSYQTQSDVNGSVIIKNYESLSAGGLCLFGGHYTSSKVKYNVWHSSNTSAPVIISNVDIRFNQWEHLAITRCGNTLMLFVNGVLSGSATISGNVNTLTHWVLGDALSAANFSYYGFIDGVRITKGVARYLSNFIPRSTQYPTLFNSDFDPYFDKISLFLDMENVTAGVAFTDRVGKTVTPANISSTQTDKRFGTSSLKFGTNSWLSIPSASDLIVGTRDFTIECWIKPDDNAMTNTYETIMCSPVTDGIFFGKTTNGFGLTTYTGADIAVSTTLPPVNVWTHVCVTRENDRVSLFYNGKLITTVTGNTTNFASGTLFIGHNGATVGTLFRGYIDNLRMTTGVARYKKNFNPDFDFPKYSINYSTFNNRIYDNYWIQTVLAMPMKDLLDLKGNTFTQYGSIGVSNTVKQFESSLAMDTDGKYLTATYDEKRYDWWNSNFTIDCWVKPSSLSNVAYVDGSIEIPTLIGKRSTTTKNYVWAFGPVSNGAVRFCWWTGTNNYISTSAGDVSPTKWTHIALNKRNNVFEIYVNGVCKVRYNYTTSIVNSSDVLSIGRGNNTNFLGYLEGLRFTKNVTRYSAGYTPDTTAFPTGGLAN